MTEEMRAIPGYPGYFVTENGVVFSNKTGVFRTIKQTVNPVSGYLQIMLRPSSKVQHARRLHTLVLTAFVGERPADRECRHLDGNKYNNHISNLIWGTKKDNLADRCAHGATAKNEDHGMSKLTNAEVRVIKKLIALGVKNRRIGEIFNVTPSNVHCIRHGKTWKTVSIA